ncbi:hypothetical protein BX600DRAFT_464454 [Xylariales sp. PMI_506]|nr:hypothetical protein BX600DRAFT_464454 [Xylariales sp. PMI_506]
MVDVKTYKLPPTALIPNSPHPLLHYPGFFARECRQDPRLAAAGAHELFERHGWRTQWIYRYGRTQPSHYHSRAHECMVVLTGSATIRFGAADNDNDNNDDDDAETAAVVTADEDGTTRYLEIAARAGDIFVLPAGVAHKTFGAEPAAEFKLLSPGTGHGIEADDVPRALAGLQLDGFTMMGAYPVTGGEWDFAVGGDDVGNYEQVWSVVKPENDPALGHSREGLVGLWQ